MLILKDNLLLHNNTSDIIEHYGVKGMKWGKRVKSISDNVRQFPKNVYNNHVENIKYSYRQKGYSEKEVERRTKRRIRNEKIALATAAAVGTSALAYKLKRDYDSNYVDRILPKGTKIQTIGDMDKLDTSRTFFGATNTSDKLRYKGNYGLQRYLEGHRDNVVDTVTTKDLKIPSKQSAAKVFKDLYDKDPAFRSGVRKSVEEFKGSTHGKTVGLLGNKKRDMMNSIFKDTKKADPFKQYDAFNAGLVSKNPDVYRD